MSRSFLDEPSDIHADLGTKPWARAVAREIRCTAENFDTDVQSLQEWIEIAAEHQAWRVLGYISLDTFLVIEANFSQSIIDAIRSAKGGTVGDAIKQARDNPLAGHGGDRSVGDAIKEARDNPLASHGERVEQGSNATLKQDRSNDYTLRRLARDKPELLDAVERGELSVNAAAIKAGIRKKPTQAEVCSKAFRKCDQEQQVEILRILFRKCDHEQRVEILRILNAEVHDE
jgi:hypothetical protein